MRLGLAFGEREARVLKIEDALSERLAAAGVLDGEFHRPLDGGDGSGRQGQPLLWKLLHEVIEAASFLAQEVFNGHPHLTEEQLRGVCCGQSHLFQIAPPLKSGSVVRLDHNQRDGARPLAVAGLGDDDDVVGVLPVGDEGLGAIEDVVVAVADGTGLDPLQVRASARFAHGDGRDQFSRGKFRQPALLLLLGAVVQNIVGADGAVDRVAEIRAHPGFLQFLDHHRFMHKAASPAAVLLRNSGQQQPHRPRLGPGLAVHLALLAPAVQVRNKFTLQELGGAFPEQFQILGFPSRGVGVHGWLVG